MGIGTIVNETKKRFLNIYKYVRGIFDTKFRQNRGRATHTSPRGSTHEKYFGGTAFVHENAVNMTESVQDVFNIDNRALHMFPDTVIPSIDQVHQFCNFSNYQ
ncbi:Oidioi.mRNA.OKI2018_I69.chr1.g2690.t1.cds [Oikopleura dioica]|uniref:Oidioi.mRNA.OKI2018_I69.chr1.g2690.t1.cds n=1 Tax=Oikopleura dioica TaxID=34765 RepID=A0ABN7SW72_OIKDI|nr:Oidioi.mRNA.OKI2018_I69.chr1.g2690.t1.cds [Oikopleura dioica]